MRYRHLFLGLLFLLSHECYSQVSDSAAYTVVKKGDKNLSLLIGYNLWQNHFLEVGIAKNQLNTFGHHPLGLTYFASTEVKVSKETILGPKLGLWIGSGAAALGLNAIYYTDFSEGAWRVRPEVGVGLDRFKVMYGYNLAVTNNEFDKINSHNVSIALLFRLTKRKE